MNRYFLGFELPAEHRLRLVKAQEHARSMLAPETRVLGMDEFHVTTLFLGKCTREAAEQICSQLTWGFGSVYFRFDSTSVFENGKGPHALVLKLHDLYGNAAMLHTNLRKAAADHPDIKMNGKVYPYNPHITLAKCEDTSDQGLVAAMQSINDKMPHNVQRTEFHCDHLALFEKVDGATSYEPHRVLRLR